MNFHELGRTRILAVGLLFQVPVYLQQRIKFFRADFTKTWWSVLEFLGRQDFCWYCFFDQQQTIYQDNNY
jgi:hypothetical protein